MIKWFNLCSAKYVITYISVLYRKDQTNSQIFLQSSLSRNYYKKFHTLHTHTKNTHPEVPKVHLRIDLTRLNCYNLLEPVCRTPRCSYHGETFHSKFVTMVRKVNKFLCQFHSGHAKAEVPPIFRYDTWCRWSFPPVLPSGTSDSP